MPDGAHLRNNTSKKFARAMRSKIGANEYANSPNTFEIAKQASRKGIGITRSINSYLADTWRPTSTGRPKANVFEAYLKEKGKVLNCDNISIPAQRRILLDKHEELLKKDKALPAEDRLMKSYTHEQLLKNDWTVHFAAELAWILMGHNFIEKLDNRPIHLRKNARFIDETTALWRFLNEDIERYRLTRRGPKPSAEKLFKASLATLVAKKLIQPKGGNSKVLPSMREVSQVWFVLFGEYESHDKIQKLLARLPEYFDRFQLAVNPLYDLERTHFQKLRPAIRLKFAA